MFRLFVGDASSLVPVRLPVRSASPFIHTSRRGRHRFTGRKNEGMLQDGRSMLGAGWRVVVGAGKERGDPVCVSFACGLVSSRCLFFVLLCVIRL